MRFRLIDDPDFFAFRRHSDGFHEGFSYYWFGATAAESNYLEIDVSALDARSLQFGAPGSQLVASEALWRRQYKFSEQIFARLLR